MVGALGHVDNHWLLVKWKGNRDPEWERQQLLECDGCHEVVRAFWAQSGLNPCDRFIQDTEGKHRCVVCCKVYKRAQDLKAHKTKMDHHHCQDHKVTNTAVTDAIIRKRIEEHTVMPQVKWGDEETSNACRTKYLDSMFEADGGRMTDVIASGCTTAVWQNATHLG